MNTPIDFIAIFVNWLLNLLIFCLFLRIILSWFPIPRGRFTEFLRELTNPIFRVVSFLPFARVGFLDLTPLFAYFLLELLAGLLQKIFVVWGANPGIYAF